MFKNCLLLILHSLNVNSHRICIWEDILLHLLQLNPDNIIQLLISGLFFHYLDTSFPTYLRCICTALIVCIVWRKLTLSCTSSVLFFILIGILLLLLSFLSLFSSLLFWLTYYLIMFFFHLADVFIITIQLEDSQWGCVETWD